ncbi:MAG TPA: hypothetical protein VGW33_03865 [Terriglobia bacterium]|nr:hypothetical protein [Terriglobia bacterium]
MIPPVIGGPPTYLLPDPVGSTNGSTNNHGVTLHICLTCQYHTARDAVDAFQNKNVDLTLIDEVRGDDITSGEDIFSVSGVHLHFKGTGSGNSGGMSPTVFPYIIDFPIHVGAQESIEGEGDCAGSSAVGCTAFILQGVPMASSFPPGVAAPTTFPAPSPVAPGSSCPTGTGLTGGTWTIGEGLSTGSGPTQSAPVQMITIPTGDCIMLTPPTGTMGGAQPINWTVFVADPTTTIPRWQATLSTTTYLINKTNYVNTTNPAPGFNLSQVGITLGISLSTFPGGDLAGKFGTGTLARDFTLNGNGAQTCIAVTTAQNQSVLSNVNVGNCGSVTSSGTTPSYLMAAIVYEGFNGITGPTAFPTRDITVFPTTCGPSPQKQPCALFNNGGGSFGTTKAILANYCILVDAALNPAPFINIALPCAAGVSQSNFPSPFAAFEFSNLTGTNLKGDIEGLHVEATNAGGTPAFFNALQNDGYNLHVAGVDCSQGTSATMPGICVQQNTGSLSSQMVVASAQTIALVDNNNLGNVYAVGQVSTGYSTSGAGNYQSPDFPNSRLLNYQKTTGSMITSPTTMYMFTVPANTLLAGRCVHAHVVFQQSTSSMISYQWVAQWDTGMSASVPSSAYSISTTGTAIIAFQDIDICEDPSPLNPNTQQITLTPAVGATVVPSSSAFTTSSITTSGTFTLNFNVTSISGSVTPVEFKVNFE